MYSDKLPSAIKFKDLKKMKYESPHHCSFSCTLTLMETIEQNLRLYYEKDQTLGFNSANNNNTTTYDKYFQSAGNSHCPLYLNTAEHETENLNSSEENNNITENYVNSCIANQNALGMLHRELQHQSLEISKQNIEKIRQQKSEMRSAEQNTVQLSGVQKRSILKNIKKSYTGNNKNRTAMKMSIIQQRLYKYKNLNDDNFDKKLDVTQNLETENEQTLSIVDQDIDLSSENKMLTNKNLDNSENLIKTPCRIKLDFIKNDTPADIGETYNISPDDTTKLNNMAEKSSQTQNACLLTERTQNNYAVNNNYIEFISEPTTVTIKKQNNRQYSTKGNLNLLQLEEEKISTLNDITDITYTSTTKTSELSLASLKVLGNSPYCYLIKSKSRGGTSSYGTTVPKTSSSYDYSEDRSFIYSDTRYLERSSQENFSFSDHQNMEETFETQNNGAYNEYNFLTNVERPLSRENFIISDHQNIEETIETQNNGAYNEYNFSTSIDIYQPLSRKDFSMSDHQDIEKTVDTKNNGAYNEGTPQLNMFNLPDIKKKNMNLIQNTTPKKIPERENNEAYEETHKIHAGAFKDFSVTKENFKKLVQNVTPEIPELNMSLSPNTAVSMINRPSLLSEESNYDLNCSPTKTFSYTDKDAKISSNITEIQQNTSNQTAAIAKYNQNKETKKCLCKGQVRGHTCDIIKFLMASPVQKRLFKYKDFTRCEVCNSHNYCLNQNTWANSIPIYDCGNFIDLSHLYSPYYYRRAIRPPVRDRYHYYRDGLFNLTSPNTRSRNTVLENVEKPLNRQNLSILDNQNTRNVTPKKSTEIQNNEICKEKTNKCNKSLSSDVLQNVIPDNQKNESCRKTRRLSLDLSPIKYTKETPIQNSSKVSRKLSFDLSSVLCAKEERNSILDSQNITAEKTSLTQNNEELGPSTELSPNIFDKEGCTTPEKITITQNNDTSEEITSKLSTDNSQDISAKEECATNMTLNTQHSAVEKTTVSQNITGCQDNNKININNFVGISEKEERKTDLNFNECIPGVALSNVNLSISSNQESLLPRQTENATANNREDKSKFTITLERSGTVISCSLSDSNDEKFGESNFMVLFNGMSKFINEAQNN